MDSNNPDTIPSAPPPPGHTPDFINPESRSYQLYILIAFLSALVFVTVSLRLYTRLRITHSFGADDLLWIPGGGILGIHLWDAPVSHYIEYQKGSLADSVLIRITSTTIKAGFLVFYLRLFGTVTYVRYLVWVGLTVVTTFCLVFVILDIVACAPFPSEHGNWVAPSLIDRCNRIAVPLITAATYISVITDFYILFIPLHQVSKLRVSTGRKIGIGFIFLTGLLAAGSALANLIIRSNKRLFDRSDFTWTIIPVYATSLLEINIGLFCYSLPVVSALFASRFTSLSKSFGSWIRERRSPRPSPHASAGESSANLANGDTEPPQLQSFATDTRSFAGMRDFFRNIHRSGARTSVHETTIPAGGEDDLDPAEIDYNLQIKNMQGARAERTQRVVDDCSL
ncbi:putative integral membrane protein [Rosellinia necatrix]|uniref:Putative integral membrane protein n=1 Tax=Rosellinia necatrix TaxID=77044 RepID=A0A1W2TKX0_ROSNE|nr:putative integral membrane protein [Rosellinia necatrix]